MRKSLLLAVFALVVTMASPVRAQFCPGASPWVFDDVPASDLFCGYITWAAQNGITLGCAVIDANHRLYCPADAVRRDQMAAFANRLTTQPDTTSIGVGTITKPGGQFLHNFGVEGTFLGVGAGNFTSTGPSNTAVGTNALKANTNGPNNTAVGANTLLSNTTGFQNTAVGASALRVTTSGGANTGMGMEALRLNTTGYNNSAFGLQALYSNTTGNDNTAAGFRSMYTNTGSNNVGLGTETLYFNSGLSNVAIGYWALRNNSSGWFNIALGAGAGLLRTTGSYNIDIGNDGVAGEGNTIRVGNPANHTRVFVNAIRGVTTGVNDAVAVVIDGAGQLGTISSSRDAKDDIADMSDASAALMQLRPVVFHYKSDRDPAGPRLQYGLIAEEVAEVYPGMVAQSARGKPETVMYQYLAPMLLNEYQKQQRTIEAQAREMAELRSSHAAEIAELRRAVEILLARTSPEGRVATR